MMFQQFGSLLVSVLLTSPTVGAKTKNLRKLARGEQRFLSSAVLDFSAFSSGTVVSALSNGVTVVAMKKTSYNSSLFPGQAMILNSTSPSTYEVDLGTPSQSFGGPGKGKGGKLGKLFANKVAHGNVLIISEDENASNPDDCTFGGTLNFRFDPPRYVESIGLINNVAGSGFEITTSDNAISLIDNYNGGSNSFERVAIGKPAVKQITVILHGGGAIADILFEKSICESVDIVDFITYPVGAVVTNLSTAVVSAMKNTTSGLVAGEAMIFDSSKPNKIDKDLGTPNRSFGGPGVGKGGKKGQLFENFMAKGNILIISEDGGEIDPEDNGLGGTLTFKFLSPTYVDSIGILDNVQGVDFKISTSDGGWTKVSDGNGGSNSFELVKLGKPGVTEIVVTLKGSGGVTELNSCSALP